MSLVEPVEVVAAITSGSDTLPIGIEIVTLIRREVYADCAIGLKLKNTAEGACVAGRAIPGRILDPVGAP